MIMIYMYNLEMKCIFVVIIVSIKYSKLLDELKNLISINHLKIKQLKMDVYEKKKSEFEEFFNRINPSKKNQKEISDKTNEIVKKTKRMEVFIFILYLK